MLEEFILLQAPTGQSSWGTLIMLGGIIIIFYFFMFRPQQKKQKETKSFIDALKKGDRIVTIGGLHGRISSIEGDTLVVEVDRGTKLTFEKSAISLEASKKLAKETPVKQA